MENVPRAAWVLGTWKDADSPAVLDHSGRWWRADLETTGHPVVHLVEAPDAWAPIPSSEVRNRYATKPVRGSTTLKSKT